MTSVAAAAVALTAAAPAWACIPPPPSDAWLEVQTQTYPAAAVGTVTAVEPITQEDCLARTRDIPRSPAGPASDACRGPLGVAVVRIDSVLSGEAQGEQRVAFGQYLTCRAGFGAAVGDRMAVFLLGETVDSPVYGPLTAWAMPEDQARGSDRLAAAFDELEAR